MIIHCILVVCLKQEFGKKRFTQITSKVFQDWSILTNYEQNRLGRIWVFWNSKVRVTPVYKSAQIITCSILHEGKEDEFYCSFVYASNLTEERKYLWEDIILHHTSNLLRNKPWLICRDFNEILNSDEHSDFGDSSCISTGMRGFQDVVRQASLVNLGFYRPRFTWCNKRENGLICKKLD